MHIRENQKPGTPPSLVVSGQQLANKNFTSRAEANDTNRSLDSNASLDSLVANLASTNQNTPKQKAYVLSEEQNTIAEILFDLGCLLSTYESPISRKEAIDCLRRSLDIKTLIMGLNHADCVIIKKRLNEIVAENINKLKSSSEQLQLHRSQSIIDPSRDIRSAMRPVSSVRQYVEVTPRQRLNKYLADFTKYDANSPSANPTGSNSSGSQLPNNPLDQWIRQNSIIEMIPSKLDLNKRESATPTPVQNQSQQQKTPQRSQTQSPMLKEQSEFVKSENGEVKESEVKPLNQPPNMKRLASAAIGSRSQQHRLRYAKLHSNSLSGPLHQRLKNGQSNPQNVVAEQVTTLHNRQQNNNRMNLSLSSHQNLDSLLIHAPNKRENHLKVIKNVYYQTAWLDHPPGSVKTRFKNFIKLAPNA